MRTPPPLPAKAATDWWGQHWRWAVPFAAVAALLAICGFAAAIFGFIRTSDAYTGALARARSSAAVIDAIGTPMTNGYFASGNISTSGPSGSAELEIPIKGPKGAASIAVRASKRLGVWHYDRMIVQVEATRQRIDLSDIPAADGRSAP